MQDKLQALEDKYLDLEAKISDPDVIANQAEWQKYARAHAKLPLTANIKFWIKPEKKRKKLLLTAATGNLRQWRRKN